MATEEFNRTDTPSHDVLLVSFELSAPYCSSNHVGHRKKTRDRRPDLQWSQKRSCLHWHSQNGGRGRKYEHRLRSFLPPRIKIIKIKRILFTNQSVSVLISTRPRQGLSPRNRPNSGIRRLDQIDRSYRPRNSDETRRQNI